MSHKNFVLRTVVKYFALPVVLTLAMGGTLVKKNLEDAILKNHIKREYLAKAIYGEGRGELTSNPDYIYGVVRSILTRAERKEKTIREIILEKRSKNKKKINVYHYTCFDPNDLNHEKIKNIQYFRNEIWEKCYSIAEQALNGKLKGNKKLENVTNYFVGGNPEKHRTKKQAKKHRIPSWAYEMKNGRFILDKNKKRIPRKPVAIVKIAMSKNAYFYNFKYF